MIRSTLTFYLYLTLALSCLPISSHGEVPEDVEQPQSQQFGVEVENSRLGPGELRVTLHPFDNVSNAENDYRSAVIFAKHGKTEGAEVLLRRALSIQADHLAARELLVSLLVIQHEIQKAIAVLEQGITSAPNHARFPLWLAQLHIKLDEHNYALNVLEQQAARFMRQPAYLGTLATLYQQSGRQIEAHQYFLKATRLSPQDGRWWLGLGMTAEELENWEEARRAYRYAKEYSFIDATLLQFAEERFSAINAQLKQQKG